MASEEPQVATPLANDWDPNLLWSKAQYYVQTAQDSDREAWLYPFWSTLALEFLVRTALASISPALLVETKSDDDTGLLYALILVSLSPGPKSAPLAKLLNRCRRLFREFTNEHQTFVAGLSGLRNQELHSGANPFEDLQPDWLPRYYDVCKVLLNTMTKKLQELFGGEADAAEKMIDALRDERAQEARKAIADHRRVWEGKSPGDQEAARYEAEKFADRSVGHPVVCPSCSCPALVTGEEISSRPPVLEDDMIVERTTMLPTLLSCVACGLRINGHSKLHAVGMGILYTHTSRADPIEHYGGAYPEWDDDNNE